MGKSPRALKIMIVEDDVDLRLLYKEALPKDWIIDLFDNGRPAALSYAESSNYDLVITDIKMAPKTGEGLIYDIKYINPFQKIIVLSGHLTELNLPESFNVRVFQKPWDIRKVIEVYENWESFSSKQE